MSKINGWIPEYICYHQPGTVAVLFDPEGGHHACIELTERDAAGAMFWSAGMVARTPEELAERIHTHWFDETPESESVYARQERCFGEQP
jgi:hypothetical protein